MLFDSAVVLMNIRIDLEARNARDRTCRSDVGLVTAVCLMGTKFDLARPLASDVPLGRAMPALG